jgi:hypothetical protein
VHFELDLRQADEWRMARVLTRLSLDEPGTNFRPPEPYYTHDEAHGGHATPGLAHPTLPGGVGGPLPTVPCPLFRRNQKTDWIPGWTLPINWDERDYKVGGRRLGQPAPHERAHSLLRSFDCLVCVLLWGLAPSLLRSFVLRAVLFAPCTRQSALVARRSSLFGSRRLARPPFSRPRDTDRTDVVVVVREGNGTKGVPHEGHLIVDYSSRAEDGCRPDVASRATLARTFFLCGLPRPGAAPPTPSST